MQTEKEWELFRMIRELEETQEKCDKARKQFEALEDDIYWADRKTRELNNIVYESYPHDVKLRDMIVEGEENIDRQWEKDQIAFQEIREEISASKKQAEQKLEEYRAELNKLRQEDKDE